MQFILIFRFPLTVLIIGVFLIFLFKGSIIMKRVAAAIAILLTGLLIIMIFQVETASPFSRPTVSEKQAELLVSKIENDPEFVSKVLLKDTRKIGGDTYDYNNNGLSVTISIYDKITYYETYDILKRNDFGYYEESKTKRKDYSSDLTANGYIEKSGENGLSVKCYPIYFVSSYKFSSVYIPFEPGGYCEEVVIEYRDKVIVLFSGANVRSVLCMDKYINTLVT